MFNRHLLKVLAGFCGMIILGLILLVVFDHYKTKDDTDSTIVSTIPTP